MIQIKDLEIQLGEFKLKEISFDVRQGEFYILLGPTGAGKSVILEAIGGLIKPQFGQIVINGKDVSYSKPEERNVSICYQDYSLFPHFTVKENILYGLQFGPKKNKKEYMKDFLELTRLLQIEHLIDRYTENLSGGEKQRVSLARALIVRPNVLLMDEPLAALDSHIKDRLMRDIKKMHEKYQMTVIMVTHSFQEAYYLGNRVSVVNDGRIIQSGTMEDILNYPNSLFVANFVGLKNIIDATEINFNETGYAGIRPENVKIINNSEIFDYIGIGVVEEIADMATYFEITLNTEFGKIISYLLFNEYIEADFMVGDKMKFGFNRKNLVILENYQC
ncbi:MAG: ATP-binding cassette domain-containing protein [Bacillota bacterium]|nr:ATP-binding cassette domain-containing protein [Bacillota bacterium]